MARYRSFTDKQKAEAMAAAKIHGMRAAERMTTIHRHSIQRWLQKPELSELLETEETDIRRAMWVNVQVGLLHIYKQLQDPDVSLKDKAYTVFGLMHRYALMNGDVTARTEIRSITSGYTDDERQRLRDFIDDLPAVNARGAGDPTADPG